MSDFQRNFKLGWRQYSQLSAPKRFLKAFLRSSGYDLVKASSPGSAAQNDVTDLSSRDRQIIGQVAGFTMTSLARVAALLNAVEYITTNKIPGDIVECGVWRGGSSMAVALALLARNETSRTLYLYDTFEGMPPPTEHDRLPDGTSAEFLLNRDAKGTGVWCEASLEDVRENLYSTGYPKEKIRLIKGKVEETVPGTLPSHISLLRLDTDWYESTRHEMLHLYPLLDRKGVLILDDYGSWMGSRKAVDEYIAEKKLKVFLHRIDANGRILIGKSD